jgi:hypothetical protein
MKPAIGRIVHYTLPETYWHYVAETDRIRPAIVTRVLTDACINLRVIYDPTDHFMAMAQEQMSVELGGDAGEWMWPPRS